MNNWMKRRIERSRARCERTAANGKTDKEQAAEKHPKLSASAPRGDDEKDG